ncbi:MAG: hypothetical protein KAQ67_09795 [Gammaproteobacteria bacterium]|nr:hypothetical protein [Gammaproteobacteria bacterium]
MQLFFMANYDMHQFRRFVESDSFANTYDLDTDQMEKLKSDDYALMHFGYDLLKQVLFGDKSIKERDDAYEKRIEERGEIIKMHQQAEREHLMIYDPRYKPDEKAKDKDLQ